MYVCVCVCVYKMSQNFEAAKTISSKSVYQNDFWRSCDTEDRSNDAESSALYHRNKLRFEIYYNRKQLL